MADGLLNKASIILTPTGYKAGTLYNVAPIDEPYEDFDFARASVASRVNSSGLVEMVGRTLGSELVTNGDFSNGSTGWNHVNTSGTSQFIVNNNQLTFTRGAFGDSFNQTDVSDGTPGVYLLTFDILAISGGNLRYSFSPNTARNISNEQTASTAKSYATYFVSDGTLLDFVFDLSANGASVTITNISVKRLIDTNNIPRISYDSNGDNGHILLEPSSTNLIPYSEDFSQWDKLSSGTGSTPIITSNYATSPDGTNNATRCIFNINSGTTTSDYSRLRYLFTSTTPTLTIFVKSNTSETYELNLTYSGDSVNVIDVTPNQWTRVEYQASASGTFGFRLELRGSYTTNNFADVLIWGAQAEALSHPTSYIPTLTGSTVTRATETATGAGSAELINSTEGVLYAEIAALTDDLSNKFISLTDGSTSNSVTIFYGGVSDRIRAEIKSGNTTQADMFISSYDITNTNKIAVKYKADDFALWINGTEVRTDTSGSTPIGLNDLSFNRAGGSPFYGKVKAVAVFNEALSDTELTQLTT